MTPEEAIKVSDAAMYVDGGCSSCVSHLMDRLVDAFPEIDWVVAFKAAAAAADAAGCYGRGEWDRLQNDSSGEPTK